MADHDASKVMQDRAIKLMAFCLHEGWSAPDSLTAMMHCSGMFGGAMAPNAELAKVAEQSGAGAWAGSFRFGFANKENIAQALHMMAEELKARQL